MRARIVPGGTVLGEISMKVWRALAFVALCAWAWGAGEKKIVFAAGSEQALLQVDRAAFGTGVSGRTLDEKYLAPDFTWTNSSGRTWSRAEVLKAFASGKELPSEDAGPGDDGHGAASTIHARAYGPVGIVRENRGKVYVLRVWVKRGPVWRVLVYQAVEIGAPPSGESGQEACENPCKTVPFTPRSKGEREVIGSYQAVERAVAAHDSAAWGSHIADEFFAVTSNSNRPLDKATRMAGLDNRKVAGIAPFPLVSARMFQLGDAMIMTSRQQPARGLPLHVTRVWFKRGGAWQEAYSYQTTIETVPAAQ